MTVAVRRARQRDQSALGPLMAAFNRSEGIPWRPRLVAPALRRLLRDRRLGVVVVAAAGERLVGHAVATYNYDLEFAGFDAFVTELYVRPAQRGRGVGRALLELVAGEVRAGGAAALHLMVRPDNAAALRLYGGCGFVRVPRLVMSRDLAR